MDATLEKLTSLAKRRGFIYQGSDIYGGLAGTWDFGPYGVALKNNIKNLWWDMFVDSRDDVHGIDAAIIMNPRVWEASGHVAGFADPLVEDLETKKRYRADHLLEENDVDPTGMSPEEMSAVIKEGGIVSPDGNVLSDVRQFNMMFKTQVGALEDSSSVAYLRPETAQGIFSNFKSVLDSLHPKMPFGIAQIGKAFRNEITPREFIFRVREMEQMEVEYFIREEEWEQSFEAWRESVWRFIDTVGLKRENVREFEVPANDLAHYSKRTIDFEYNYPNKGFDELLGLAYRTDHDLQAHQEHSGVSQEYTTPEGEKFVPHVIEPSFGVDRMLMALLSDAYTEDAMGDGRVFLKFHPRVAPVKAAVFPLLKNKPQLVEKAREVYDALKAEIPRVMWDDNGNVGKRYRRQDEIGTPFCITVDFDTLGDGDDAATAETVTVRDRDTGEQERIAIADLVEYIKTRTQ